MFGVLSTREMRRYLFEKCCGRPDFHPKLSGKLKWREMPSDTLAMN